MVEVKHSMAPRSPNTVRKARESSAITQLALAAHVGLTRQSLSAIEAGRATPAVDIALRLARALGCTVEQLFGDPHDAHDFNACPTSPVAHSRLALAYIDARWLSYPLLADDARLSADALITGTPPTTTLLRPLAEARDNLVLYGCAPALGLLADRLNARPGAGRFLWFSRSSTAALEALARRHAHLAGVHLTDPSTGEANLPDVRRHAGPGPQLVITLARWQAGLIAAAGNPKQIRGADDLGRDDLRLVLREPGSGARRLLDRELQSRGLSPPTSALTASSHLHVAQLIHSGAAQLGLATHDAALTHGLHFIPLADERYDLVLPLTHLHDPRIQRLLDAMTTGAFRRELRALGYDVQSCGDRVAQLHAA
jgi:putative molybdopterin biosynthesis protein